MKIKIKPFFESLLQECFSKAHHEVIEVVKDSLGDVLFYRIKHPVIDDKTTLIFPHYCTVVEETPKPKKVYFMLKNFFCHEKLKNNVPYKGKLNSDGSIVCDGYTFDEFNEHYMESITKDQYKAMKAARVRAEIEESLREELRLEYCAQVDALENKNEELQTKIQELDGHVIYWKNRAETIEKQTERAEVFRAQRDSLLDQLAKKDEAYKKLLSSNNLLIKQSEALIDENKKLDEFCNVGSCSHSSFYGQRNITTIEIFNCDWHPEHLVGKDVYIKI